MWSISLVRGRKVKAKPVDTMFARLRPVFAMVGTIEPFNDHIWYLGFRCKVPTTGSWSPGSGSVCDGAFWEEVGHWRWALGLYNLAPLPVHTPLPEYTLWTVPFLLLLLWLPSHDGMYPLKLWPLQTHSPLSCFLSCVWSQWWEK